MGYQWDFKPRTTIPDKKLMKIQKAQMPFELNYILTHIIQTMSGKVGSLDQASKVQVQMGYSVIVGRHFDYVGAIFEDLLSKIEKAERDIKIPYVRFISVILHYFLGDKYPKESDCSFSKVGPRILEVMPAKNEMVSSSATPATTTFLKRKLLAISGTSKKARKVMEQPPLANIHEVVSQQTTLDGFVARSSTTATTRTVSVTMAAETPPVTSQISSVTQPQPEVISIITNASSSIPTTSPSISLVSNLPPLQRPILQTANVGPGGLPFGGLPQTSLSFPSFEGYLAFYNMFDTSGLTLGTVDTSLTKHGEKVEAFATSINTNTTAVNNAGEELKCLSTTISSKLKHLNSTLSKLSKVKILGGEVDDSNRLLTQILSKMNAPTPVPTPSFTDDDRMSLNITVDESVVAEEKAPPSPSPMIVEEEKEEEEEEDDNLDLEDQEADDVIADDDEYEDPSQCFSTINVSSTRVMKVIVLNEAGGRQKDKAPDTSSQGKQKGIAAEGNLRLLSPSQGELPS
ncbi:hypothetical protein L6452_37364 [Arctium lappa]|uniref:Uncharacterized protein n=1 Tax=Arctium lappa TaxID=4217 RepID=A0ACB8Y2U6_ARCLA|nr:hypothetical protein L6452_37364 [Arctium lappa]